MILDNDKFILSTGKSFAAYENVIGLSPGKNNLYEGYDGTIDHENWDVESRLTKEEKLEIAEFMIHAWINYKHTIFTSE